VYHNIIMYVVCVYIMLYIYMCECVCVCVCISNHPLLHFIEKCTYDTFNECIQLYNYLGLLKIRFAVNVTNSCRLSLFASERTQIDTFYKYNMVFNTSKTVFRIHPGVNKYLYVTERVQCT